ncbi:T9SS type A sorting domain-containing protein [Brumimicrobium glaciale]|uniref:T9SS type A sorting domain-containing protein n=1 Tax=Brumimicrobium glaciale TaxID=200475 RepID=A0A4Q4KKP5_9FLAO|nr:T9SS type A sorting domain-containing protein [Brumimicrobium glaciale]RYM33882.1 T9SS type A sorting domain-containing protein [Brumimicrobium glaciale]
MAGEIGEGIELNNYECFNYELKRNCLNEITQIPTNGASLNVNVNSWAKGVYYIKVNGSSFSKTLKYLKQ